MKILSIYALCLGLIAAAQSSTAERSTAVAPEASLTAQQVIEKTRQYYDPQNHWATFSGKVRLISTFNNSLHQEVLEIRNAEGFYQSTKTREDNVTIQGVEHGECFREANGDRNLSPEAIKQLGLGCDNIMFSQQHHTAHIGLVMQLSESGMKMSEEVKQEEFRCQPVYAISFSGEASEVTHTYWGGAVTLYVSMENYALLGYQYQSALYQAKVALEGETLVNNIRLPQTKIYYNLEDGAYMFTDVLQAVQ